MSPEINRGLQEDTHGYAAVSTGDIPVEVINYYVELQKWLRQELAAGASKRDIISIIENQTNWDKEKIVHMFPELKSNKRKVLVIAAISLVLLLAAVLLLYPAFKEGFAGKAIGLACQQDSDCSEREICRNRMCVFDRTTNLIAHYDFSAVENVRVASDRFRHQVRDLSGNSNELRLEHQWKVRRGVFNAEGTTADYLFKQHFSGLEGASAVAITFQIKGGINQRMREEGIVSYAAENSANELLVYYINGEMMVYVKNRRTGRFAIPNIYDGNWHDVGVTWDGRNGKVRVYVDGEESSLTSGSRVVSAGSTLSGDGSLVIGQDQDCMFETLAGGGIICDGNFEAVQSFYGELDNLRIYTTVLSRGEIASLPEAVEMLVGGPGIGIGNSYRAGNLGFSADVFHNDYNPGEIGISCVGSCVFWGLRNQRASEVHIGDGLVLGTDSRYCNSHRESRGCDYIGYVMYSAEDIHTRFGDNVYATQGNNVIGVCYYDGQWYYDDNNACNEPFTPVNTDILLAEYTVDNGLVVSVTDLKLCTSDSLGECTSREQCTATGYYWYNNRCNSSPDADNDGIADTEDNCPVTSNANQQNDDEDQLGNSCDNCPRADNPTQKDSDKDHAGDACDNCPGLFNPLQSNLDLDDRGDLCDDNMDGDMPPNDEDLDDDMDGIADALDNCPLSPNINQVDADRDTIGDRCDNCPQHSNAGQEDFDLDNLGDRCDNNDDNDLILDAADRCPHDNKNDIDSDGLCGDVDNCPYYRNPEQEDADQDGLGDACDLNHCAYEVPVIGTIDVGSARGSSACADRILDVFGEATQLGVLSNVDCAGIYKGITIIREAGTSLYSYVNEWFGTAAGFTDWNNLCPQYVSGKPEDSWVTVGQYKVPRFIEEAKMCIDENAALLPGYDMGCDDIGGDSVVGDDGDADRVPDNVDNCPGIANPDQLDDDADGKGNACDNCPNVVNLEQVDSEGDGLGDACDDDDDNDGIVDEHFNVILNRIDRRDNCRIVPNPEQLDGDEDDIGNECDGDKDNDGALNENDNCLLFANPGQEDADGDGLGDVCDELNYCDLELIPELVGGFADGESACARRAKEEGAASFARISGTCEHISEGIPLMKQLGSPIHVYGTINEEGVFSQSTAWQDKCSGYLLAIVGVEGIAGWDRLSNGPVKPRTEEELFAGDWVPHSVREAKRCIEPHPEAFDMFDGSCRDGAVEQVPEAAGLSLLQYYTPGCGIDSDNDGNKCDAYENMLNCPEDCDSCPAEVGGVCVSEGAADGLVGGGIADADRDGLSDDYETYLDNNLRTFIVNNRLANGGVDVNALTFYSSNAADSDGDGVPDHADYCPGTETESFRDLDHGYIKANGCYAGDIKSLRRNGEEIDQRPDGCFELRDFTQASPNFYDDRNIPAALPTHALCKFKLKETAFRGEEVFGSLGYFQYYTPSCGIDGNNDGSRCDAYENMLNCPEDCNSCPLADGAACIGAGIADADGDGLSDDYETHLNGHLRQYLSDNGLANVGVDVNALTFYSSASTDSDGDGIPDNVDYCPGTITEGFRDLDHGYIKANGCYAGDVKSLKRDGEEIDQRPDGCFELRDFTQASPNFYDDRAVPAALPTHALCKFKLKD